jgi:hypothetical protein
MKDVISILIYIISFAVAIFIPLAGMIFILEIVKLFWKEILITMIICLL